MASSSGVDIGNQPAKRSTRRSNPMLPPSFVPAPENLTPFLDTLDKRRVYITHVDIHPGWFKRRIFAVPVIINLVLAGILGWRLYVIFPWYTELVVKMIEKPSDFGQHFAGLGGGVRWTTVAWTIVTRALNFLLDFVLVTVIAPWPYSFFMERPANPMKWRTHIRFRDQEVIVRISRGWGVRELMGGIKKGTDSPFFKTRIGPNITKETWLKTGYLLMGPDWDLEFAPMLTIHELADEEIFKLRDIDKKVFAFYPPPTSPEAEGQWLIHDIPVPVEELSQGVDFSFEGSEDGKKKIIEMKDKLSAMGKEDLFFKWVQLVQDETQKPGGFTKERQLEAGLKVQALFEEAGVDWLQFAKDVGLPGAEGQ